MRGSRRPAAENRLKRWPVPGDRKWGKAEIECRAERGFFFFRGGSGVVEELFGFC